MSFLDISSSLLIGQFLLGIINGSFYAILSIGLALIFGMLRVINFAHGALYMLGAFVAWTLSQSFGIGFWWALILSPFIVALLALVFERTMLSKVYAEEHVSGLLLTLGFGMLIEGTVRYYFGNSLRQYPAPAVLQGVIDLGIMVVPKYRAFVLGASLSICLLVWVLIERTRLGAYLRAATENPILVKVFGINVPRMMALTYAAGGALAAFAGVIGAPIYQVSPLMGHDLIIIIFAIVVIGGIGSILGSVITSLILGIAEAMTKVFYPEAASTVVFLIMALTILVRPYGLFGREA